MSSLVQVRLFWDKPKIADFLLVNTSNRDCANTKLVTRYYTDIVELVLLECVGLLMMPKRNQSSMGNNTFVKLFMEIRCRAQNCFKENMQQVSESRNRGIQDY